MSTLEFITGCMFCGKTEELIRRLRREKIAGKEVVIFKPAIDDRYEFLSVSSHNRSQLPATPINETKDMYKCLSSRVQVVGIDEVQFLDDAVIDFCLEQVAVGRNVIASGLNLDFRGEPFRFMNSQKHVGYLMAYAINTTLRAICVYEKASKNESGSPERCGAEADFTQRLIDGQPAPYDSPLIVVGSKDSYEARCRAHFAVPRKV
ncbi:thymidine kinase [Candidatus Woesearchaeota archaeon]|nr:thymidine kinase [Candidatus Woesearchaeota archaeon]